jgi:4-hydroxybenzoate polyprenyltransferase
MSKENKSAFIFMVVLWLAVFVVMVAGPASVAIEFIFWLTTLIAMFVLYYTTKEIEKLKAKK